MPGCVIHATSVGAAANRVWLPSITPHPMGLSPINAVSSFQTTASRALCDGQRDTHHVETYVQTTASTRTQPLLTHELRGPAQPTSFHPTAPVEHLQGELTPPHHELLSSILRPQRATPRLFRLSLSRRVLACPPSAGVGHSVAHSLPAAARVFVRRPRCASSSPPSSPLPPSRGCHPYLGVSSPQPRPKRCCTSPTSRRTRRSAAGTTLPPTALPRAFPPLPPPRQTRQP